MKKDINIVSFLLLFSIIGLYSCSSSQRQMPTSTQDTDSIIISSQHLSEDILTYNKFYYDKAGDCVREMVIDVAGEDTIFFSQSIITADQKEELIRTNNSYVTRVYNNPIVTADSTTQIIRTSIKTPSTSENLTQSLSSKQDGEFISQTCIYPTSSIDTFGVTRTYTFNGLISREQFFDPETQKMSRQIIYTYDSNDNITSKAIKEKRNPRVYTYDYTTYDEDGNWKTRDEYLNKKHIATATQEVYKRK